MGILHTGIAIPYMYGFGLRGCRVPYMAGGHEQVHTVHRLLLLTLKLVSTPYCVPKSQPVIGAHGVSAQMC